MMLQLIKRSGVLFLWPPAHRVIADTCADFSAVSTFVPDDSHDVRSGRYILSACHCLDQEIPLESRHLQPTFFIDINITDIKLSSRVQLLQKMRFKVHRRYASRTVRHKFSPTRTTTKRDIEILAVVSRYQETQEIRAGAKISTNLPRGNLWLYRMRLLLNVVHLVEFHPIKQKMPSLISPRDRPATL